MNAFSLESEPCVCVIPGEGCGHHPDVVLMGCDRAPSFPGPGRKNVTEESLMSFHPHFNYPNKLPKEPCLRAWNLESSDKPRRDLPLWQLRMLLKEGKEASSRRGVCR